MNEGKEGRKEGKKVRKTFVSYNFYGYVYVYVYE